MNEIELLACVFILYQSLVYFVIFNYFYILESKSICIQKKLTYMYMHILWMEY
jgi:hypothetical protein